MAPSLLSTEATLVWVVSWEIRDVISDLCFMNRKVWTARQMGPSRQPAPGGRGFMDDRLDDASHRGALNFLLVSQCHMTKTVASHPF